MGFLKKIWLWIVGAFGLVLGLLFIERSRRQSTEISASKEKLDAEQAVLKYQQQVNSVELQQLKDQATQQEQQTNSKASDLTPEQVEEYWKNR